MQYARNSKEWEALKQAQKNKPMSEGQRAVKEDLENLLKLNAYKISRKKITEERINHLLSHIEDISYKEIEHICDALSLNYIYFKQDIAYIKKR